MESAADRAVALGGPGPGGPPGGPAPPPDEVALMTQRLQSFYSNNRKEAAYKLGQLGDPRAVPSLVHVLKYDSHKDVRIAAAIALGEIGGSEAAIALERASIYDHKEDVRHACRDRTRAIEREGQGLSAASRRRTGGRVVCRRPPEPTTPSPFRGYAGDAGNSRLNRRRPTLSHRRRRLIRAANQPPPPPTPVTGSPGSANR